jgi:hypothetical protein
MVKYWFGGVKIRVSVYPCECPILSCPATTTLQVTEYHPLVTRDGWLIRKFLSRKCRFHKSHNTNRDGSTHLLVWLRKDSVFGNKLPWMLKVFQCFGKQYSCLLQGGRLWGEMVRKPLVLTWQWTVNGGACIIGRTEEPSTPFTAHRHTQTFDLKKANCNVCRNVGKPSVFYEIHSGILKSYSNHENLRTRG